MHANAAFGTAAALGGSIFPGTFGGTVVLLAGGAGLAQGFQQDTGCIG